MPQSLWLIYKVFFKESYSSSGTYIKPKGICEKLQRVCKSETNSDMWHRPFGSYQVFSELQFKQYYYKAKGYDRNDN